MREQSAEHRPPSQRKREAGPAGGSDAEVAALVRRVRRGEGDAWRELLDRYTALVRAVARGHRLCDADVADVVQTTWLRACEHVHRLERPERLPAWLVTVARRESLHVLRGRRRLALVGDEPLPEREVLRPVDADLLERERDAALWQAVGVLPARQRDLLRLLASEPAPSYELVGSELEMPVGSIGPTRLRALGRLRADAELAAVAAAD